MNNIHTQNKIYPKGQSVIRLWLIRMNDKWDINKSLRTVARFSDVPIILMENSLRCLI